MNIEPLAGLGAPTMQMLEQVRFDCENVCASEVLLCPPSVAL